MVHEMKKFLNKINSIKGEISFDGDKSISHRAVFFSAMSDGISEIENLSHCEDLKTTISAFENLGAKFIFNDRKTIVYGVGKYKFNEPFKEIYCGNSGTTARLLSGILSAQKFNSTITGDESLSKRPMKRIIEPLQKMGAKISHNNFHLPLQFHPVEKLNNLKFDLVIPSAQVKSCILLAGLFVDEETIINESIETRNHTEKMLNLPVLVHNRKKIIKSSSRFYPQSNYYYVPGDISSAAFFIVLTLLSKNSELIIRNVSLNPTRIGFINILQKMNARIEIKFSGKTNNEEYGDLIIKSSKLRNIHIENTFIPNIIDEIPILTIAGIFADGDFQIRNCKELRFKETDRISALSYNLKSLGLNVKEFDDGLFITGYIKNKIGDFKTFDDHRIAMAFSILSMLIDGGGYIDNPECVNISNPAFYNQLNIISY